MNQTPMTNVERIEAVQALAPEAMREALLYLSGYSPDGFAGALRHLEAFPTPPPWQDRYTPRHSAAHREVSA